MAGSALGQSGHWRGTFEHGGAAEDSDAMRYEYLILNRQPFNDSALQLNWHLHPFPFSGKFDTVALAGHKVRREAWRNGEG